jgi:hypothetical protein
MGGEVAGMGDQRTMVVMKKEGYVTCDIAYTTVESSRLRTLDFTSVSDFPIHDSLCVEVSTIYSCVILLLLGSVTDYVYPRFEPNPLWYYVHMYV